MRRILSHLPSPANGLRTAVLALLLFAVLGLPSAFGQRGLESG
jgi:hypothetical protein